MSAGHPERRAALLWLLLVGAGAVILFLLAHHPAEAPAGPGGALVLLDQTLVPGPDGARTRVVVPVPGEVEVEAEAPMGAALRLRLGPPAPVDARRGRYDPDPDGALEISGSGRASGRQRFHAVGAFALAIDPIPSAMEADMPGVHVRVLLHPESAGRTTP